MVAYRPDPAGDIVLGSATITAGERTEAVVGAAAGA
jgi:hypothetical protein